MVIGNAVAFTDVTVTVTGSSLTSSIDSVTIDLNTPVDLIGIVLTTAIGEEIPQGNANVSITGQSLTTAVESVVPVSTYSVTGISLTTGIGSVITQANSNVIVTGNSLSTAEGSTIVTAWAEINTGVINTWTDVDLAA